MFASPSPDQSPARRRRGVPLPHQREGPLLPVNTSRCKALAALKVTFYFHLLYFSTGEEFFFSRLNMTFDKDVFVVPSQDILGVWCRKGDLNMGVGPRPKRYI